MRHLEFATVWLLELYMRNRWPVMSASNLKMVSYAPPHFATGLAEAPHW